MGTQETLVTPENIQNKLDNIRPGDIVVFSPGLYTAPLLLKDKYGTSEAPIRLIAEAGAIITMYNQGLKSCTEIEFFEQHRLRANKVAKGIQDMGKFPKTTNAIHDAMFTLDNSEHISLEGFMFEKTWPTHVFINNCRHISVTNCEFRDGTFAVGASGENTHDIHIQSCSWVQDTISGRMWSEIEWKRIHGDIPEHNVDVKNDFRLFDGSFFRGKSIAGDVTISKCKIHSAFNAIRLTRHGPNSNMLSHNILVHDCSFYEIKDNILEPEEGGSNWTFKNNIIEKSYRPIALETKQKGRYKNFLIQGNAFDLRDKPGPPTETHDKPAVFKVTSLDSITDCSVIFTKNTIYADRLVSSNISGSDLQKVNKILLREPNELHLLNGVHNQS